MWPNNYSDALVEWNELRTKAAALSIEESLHTIHDWWARAPLVHHYLHLADYTDWPNPWQLLADNNFCDIAKSLSIVYSILLVDHKGINSLHLVTIDNYNLVVVNNGEYILNDQPGNIYSDIDISGCKYSIDCEYFRSKIK